MRAASKAVGVILASAVWLFAGFTVASGSQAPKAITPVSLDATAACPATRYI
jgi:hypothetical protein